MGEVSDQKKLEEIYLVLTELRYLLHKESNTLEDYRKICSDYYKRVADGAAYAGELLPEEVVARLDDD